MHDPYFQEQEKAPDNAGRHSLSDIRAPNSRTRSAWQTRLVPSALMLAKARNVRRASSVAVVLIWALLVGLAFLYRVSVLDMYPNAQVAEDSFPYVASAERLLKGEPLLFQSAPGYPLFLSIVFRFTQDLFHVAVIQHALALATALLLCRLLTVSGVATPFRWLLFILVGFNHFQIYYDGLVITEGLATFVTAVACFALAKAAAKQWTATISAAVAGLAVGFGATIRPSLLAILPVVAAFVVLAWQEDERPVRSRLIRLTVCLGVAAVVLIGMNASIRRLPVAPGSTLLTAVMTGAVSIAAEVSPSDQDRDIAALGQLIADARSKLHQAELEGRFARGELQRLHLLEGEVLEYFYNKDPACRDAIAAPVRETDAEMATMLERMTRQCTEAIAAKNALVQRAFVAMFASPGVPMYRFVSHGLKQTFDVLFGTGSTTRLTAPPGAFATLAQRASFLDVIARTDRKRGSILERLATIPLLGPILVPVMRVMELHIDATYLQPGLEGFVAVGNSTLRLVSGVGAIITALFLCAGASRFGQALVGGVLPVFAVGATNALVAGFLLYALHRYAYHVLPFTLTVTCAGLSMLTASMLGIAGRHGGLDTRRAI
ncbi:hypothetical protein JQ634_30255 [Bradyrhizobium sp. AUGA SZCCT0240]|nr:hypothetical protein [Bradyrhizobium sp. AUGA SZCCT0240]